MATTNELLDMLADLDGALCDAEEHLAQMAEDDPARPDVLAVYEEVTAAFGAWFETDMPAKLQALLAYADGCKALEKQAADKAKEWKAVQDRRKKRRERCIDSALKLIEANGGPVKMPGGREARIAERKSVAVHVKRDAARLPSAFRVTTHRPDKIALKRYLEGGAECDFARLVENISTSVKVRDR